MKYLLRLITVIYFLVQAGPGISQDSYQRIDPPFWWVGMADSSLQLMVLGNDIAGSNVVVNYPGVVLKSTIRLENPDYLILNLEIARNTVPGKIPIVFEYQREILFMIDYEIRERETGAAERTGFGKDDVIYLIMPDRFSNGNPYNDSVEGMLEAADRSDPNGRHGGDIEGINDQLGYLSALGVTALWFNPLLENNMPAYSYHGYAITDHYRVDPRFGDNETYRSLVSACHREGMKVIMDMVFNHVGDNHFWLHNMPMENWIHQFPEYTKSNFRAETIMDPYASDFDKERMLTGWFDRHMPDLNQQNEILAGYLIQNSIWWVEYAGLDGIRMDTYPYSYKDFMLKWIERLFREYPNFSVLGETWLQKESQTAWWQAGSPLNGEYSSMLPSVTDFPLKYAIKDAFTTKEGWTTGLASLYYVLSQDMVYPNPFLNVIFADNHDLTRLYTDLGEDFKKFKMVMAVLLTTRGIPMVYYGTELLMTGEEPKGHGFIREDFPLGEWQPAVDGRPSAVDSMQLEALQYVKTLLNWRKHSEVIHKGEFKQFVPENGTYVYFRYTENDAVMVVINKNPEDRQLSLSRFNEVLKDYRGGRNVINGQVLRFDDSLFVPAETALIIELRK